MCFCVVLCVFGWFGFVLFLGVCGDNIVVLFMIVDLNGDFFVELVFMYIGFGDDGCKGVVCNLMVQGIVFYQMVCIGFVVDVVEIFVGLCNVDVVVGCDVLFCVMVFVVFGWVL